VMAASRRSMFSSLPLPPQFVDSLNPASFDPSTYQRNDVLVHPVSGVKLGTGSHPCRNAAPPESYLSSVNIPGPLQCTSHPSLGVFSPPPIKHWRGDSSDFLHPSETLPFSEVTQMNSSANAKALELLYTFGVVIITGTPKTHSEIYRLSKSFTGPSAQDDEHLKDHEYNVFFSTSGPLRTLYGSTWATTTNSSVQSDSASTADSAYSQDSLPLHTDNTYFKTPPGLQIFNMAMPAKDGSGKSTYLDGFGAAEELRRTCRDSFDCLSKTIFRYRSIDIDTGWHLEVSEVLRKLGDSLLH